MLRIVITADRCDELRTFLNQWSNDVSQRPPMLFRDVSDLPRPHGCYIGKHAKNTGAVDGRSGIGVKK